MNPILRCSFLIAWPALLCAGEGPCATAGTSAVFAPAAEPGKRMVVAGRVFQADGRTPAAGVILYAYHTDAKGEYGGDEASGPRLRGWLRTDAEGRYRFESIRPMPYPNGRIAAHVHFQAWGASVPPQHLSELLFEEDPYLSGEEKRRSRELGSFGFVHRGEERDGVLHITHDIRLKESGDGISGPAGYGLRACRAR
jgi:protocatechuate 3,4-dioxygenase beta subunit